MRLVFIVTMISLSGLAACERAAAPTPVGAPTETARTEVRQGMRTAIFEASSRRELRITDGTQRTDIKDASGVVRGVTLARDDNGVSIECACPGGCQAGPTGCWVVQNDDLLSCTGECSTDNSSCTECGWSFPTPPSNDPRSGLVRDLSAGSGGVLDPDAGGSTPPPADAADATPNSDAP